LRVMVKILFKGSANTVRTTNRMAHIVARVFAKQVSK
jgi:hypothetical protein